MSRKRVVLGVFVALASLTALVLVDVFATVFFAMTVAYVSTPVYNWLRDRGVPKWWASAATTTFAFVSAVAVFAPIVVVVYLRRGQLVDLIAGLPSEVTLSLFDYSTTITLAEAQRFARDVVQDAAFTVASQLPTLLIKLGLFALVLFSLFLAGDRVKRSVLTIVPEEYHDLAAALVGRGKETLYAIYVLQAVTGFGTFLIGVPVFWLLGYDAPFGLAMIAGILQFVPIVGPSVLIVVLATFEIALGNVVGAIQIVVVAGLFVALAPDLVIRPRFARRTADMPGSLYFIGFTGGVFSLGPVGIIAGPLIVALFSESVRLLASEMQDSVDSPLADKLGYVHDGGEASEDSGASADEPPGIDDESDLGETPEVAAAPDVDAESGVDGTPGIDGESGIDERPGGS